MFISQPVDFSFKFVWLKLYVFLQNEISVFKLEFLLFNRLDCPQNVFVQDDFPVCVTFRFQINNLLHVGETTDNKLSP